MQDNTIRDNINSFEDAVKMPGGYEFNHKATLQRINLYYNSKFESGDTDSLGNQKYFYNISQPACDIARKFIDLDTKDINLHAESPEDEFRTWVMQKDLRLWLKENDFGVTLNKIGHNYPKYGHVVIKKSKDNKWHIVDLEAIRTDLAISNLKDSSFVYELHRMTAEEIRSMGWKEKKVEELLQDNKSLYDIWECYQKNGDKYQRYFKGKVFEKKSGVNTSILSSINEKDEYVPSITLYKDTLDQLPYRELKWEDIPGRWLGRGYVEYLFDNQVRINEVTNLKARKLQITALSIFATKDQQIGKNILTDVENGEIIKTTAEIIPIANEERNLAAFRDEEMRWDRNTEQKTFSFDVARGENQPSGTPLGVVNLSAQMVASFFELKREQFGLFLRALLIDDVIPEFKKRNNKKHALVFSSRGDIEKFDEFVIRANVEKSAYDYAMRTGFFPSKEEREQEIERIKSDISRRKNRFADIPEGFYTDAKYKVDISTTGENINPNISTVLTQIISIIGSNPAVLQNKATRTMLFKLMEVGGVNPIDLNVMEEAAAQEPQMLGQLPNGTAMPTPEAPAMNMMQGVKPL